jgi:hypothetical protein
VNSSLQTATPPPPQHTGHHHHRRRRLRALQEEEEEEEQEPPSSPPPPAAAAAPVTAYTADALADEIIGPLPGLSPEAAAKAGRFRQFSGYLPISEYK